MKYPMYAWRDADTGEIFAPCMFPEGYEEKAIIKGMYESYFNSRIDKNNKLIDMPVQMINMFNSSFIVRLGYFDNSQGIIPDFKALTNKDVDAMKKSFEEYCSKKGVIVNGQ